MMKAGLPGVRPVYLFDYMNAKKERANVQMSKLRRKETITALLHHVISTNGKNLISTVKSDR